jgi:hypothetical protein
MTALVLQHSQNFLQSLLNGLKIVGKQIGSIFISIAEAAERSQQIRANEYLATVMKHEYPDMTYHELLAHLNQKTISTWK